MGKYLVSVYRLIDSHTLTHMLCWRLFTVIKWLCGHSVIVPVPLPCCYGLIASRSNGVSAAYTIHAYGAGAAESDCIGEEKVPSNSEHSYSC